jgi:ubiquitin-conjugating enzyme E2 Z
MDEPKIVISGDTVKRLLKDVRQVLKHPLTDNGIYYIHDDTDMTKGYAMIIGPTNTPYFGGYYFFAFDFPFDYPFTPPNVTYMTNDGVTRFNPNLYINGKVCVSILNTWAGEKWSSCQTINSVLLTLCSLLNESPLENEPGQTVTCRDFDPYQKSIEYKNIDFAICDMFLKRKIPPVFQAFYPFMREQFIHNYDKLLAYVHSKLNEQSIQHVFIYKMTTNINYATLEYKLIETKKFIDSQK